MGVTNTRGYYESYQGNLHKLSMLVKLSTKISILVANIQGGSLYLETVSQFCRKLLYYDRYDS